MRNLSKELGMCNRSNLKRNYFVDLRNFIKIFAIYVSLKGIKQYSIHQNCRTKDWVSTWVE